MQGQMKVKGTREGEAVAVRAPETATQGGKSGAQRSRAEQSLITQPRTGLLHCARISRHSLFPVFL